MTEAKIRPYGSISRRRFFKNFAELGAMGALGFSSPLLKAVEGATQKPRKRLAIIGGGMGGLATAWLCDSDWSIDLFESRDKLGGHCDSIEFDYRGTPLVADLGAQFFHPDTHPLYLALLEELGLYKKHGTDHDEVLEAKGSLTIFPMDQDKPYFISEQPLQHPLNALAFGIYAQYARGMITRNGSYETSLEDWVHSLPLTKAFKEHVLLPWISALIGTTVENARISSARSILQTYALAFPKNIFKNATTWNSRIGMQGNLMRMISSCQNLSAHTSSPVAALERTGDLWYVHTNAGRQGPYDHLVLNAQAQFSKHWLAELPGSEALVALLDRYRYFDARLVIHEDPCYMTKDRGQWSVYNAGIQNGRCEGSVWLGGIHDEIDGNKVDIFKSWAFQRQTEPTRLIGERRFKHPLITPDIIRAARSLRNWQGRDNLWFAGQYTTGFDLQEAALYSATQVARVLNPDSPNLKALLARSASNGRPDINYDL